MTQEELARKITLAVTAAAEEAYEDAGIRGLCAEGRWEAALSALRSLDLRALLGELPPPAPPGDSGE